MYNRLIDMIRAAGIPVAEVSWNNAPQTGNYAVIMLDSEAASVSGDNKKVDYAAQGTVDLFCRSKDRADCRALEGIFNALEIAWEWNSTQYEADRHLIHYEYVFELEAV